MGKNPSGFQGGEYLMIFNGHVKNCVYSKFQKFDNVPAEFNLI